MSVGIVVTFVVESDDQAVLDGALDTHMRLLEVAFGRTPVKDVHVTALPNISRPHPNGPTPR